MVENELDSGLEEDFAADGARGHVEAGKSNRTLKAADAKKRAQAVAQEAMGDPAQGQRVLRLRDGRRAFAAALGSPAKILPFASGKALPREIRALKGRKQAAGGLNGRPSIPR